MMASLAAVNPDRWRLLINSIRIWGGYILFNASVPVDDYELSLGCDFVKNGHLDYTGGTTINGIYDHVVVHVR